MHPTNSDSVSPSTLEDAVAAMRRNATCVQDIEQWLYDHRLLMSALPEHLANRVVVDVTLHDDSYHHLADAKPVGSTVKWQVPRMACDNNPLQMALGLQGEKGSVYDKFYHMAMPFRLWPVCSAWLLHAYLHSDGPDWLDERARLKLDKYLPQHFPDVKVETLQAMHASGLLPADKAEFAAWLVSSRDLAQPPCQSEHQINCSTEQSSN